MKKKKYLKISEIFYDWKKKKNYTAIKDIRNLFRQEKETKAIKGRIPQDINNLIEHQEESESKSNDDGSKTLSVEDYLNKIRPYLKQTNNLKKSDTWKIQLTMANIFISSIDNDEDHVIHSKSNNMEIMIDGEADEVINELFD